MLGPLIQNWRCLEQQSCDNYKPFLVKLFRIWLNCMIIWVDVVCGALEINHKCVSAIHINGSRLKNKRLSLTLFLLWIRENFTVVMMSPYYKEADIQLYRAASLFRLDDWEAGVFVRNKCKVYSCYAGGIVGWIMRAGIDGVIFCQAA